MICGNWNILGLGHNVHCGVNIQRPGLFRGAATHTQAPVPGVALQEASKHSVNAASALAGLRNQQNSVCFLSRIWFESSLPPLPQCFIRFCWVKKKMGIGWQTTAALPVTFSQHFIPGPGQTTRQATPYSALAFKQPHLPFLQAYFEQA